MLRCPPSCIHLTPSDVADLEHRLAARHSARHATEQPSNVRLSRGPHRSTWLSTVSSDNNTGKKRAESSSSTATFCEVDTNRPDESAPSSLVRDNATLPVVSTPAKELQSTQYQPDLYNEATSALNGVVVQKYSLDKSLHLQQECPTDTKQGDISRPIKPPREGCVESAVDGTFEAHDGYTFVYTTPSVPYTRRGNHVLGEIHSDAYPLGSHRTGGSNPSHRLLSSARARRRQTRSHDIEFHRDPDGFADGQFNTHGRDIFEQAAHPLPELVPFDRPMQSSLTATLDPGAAVFMPRTRFGGAARSPAENGVVGSLEPRWGSLDSTHDVSDLRIRSTSEQNIGRRFRPNRNSGHAATLNVAEPGRHQARPGSQQRERRGIGDQNMAFADSRSDLERYPLLQPASTSSSRHRPARIFRSSFGGAAEVLERRSATSHSPQEAPTLDHGYQPVRIQTAFVANNSDTLGLVQETRPGIPAVRSTSWSTPDLLSFPRSAARLCTRNSASWMDPVPRWPISTRGPNMVSTANEANGDLPLQSTQDDLDAAQEFIRRRNSPLDELTDRFSRMRSVGRSWERTPGSRPRLSLLSGNPFGQVPSRPDPAGSHSMELRQTVQGRQVNELEGEERNDSVVADPVALSLALPPSSPISSSLQMLPSTPEIPATSSSSKALPLAQRSPIKSKGSPGPSIKRKPVPDIKSPRVDVYNDDRPPNTQPQTPADIASSRRAKSRSETMQLQSPIRLRRTPVETSTGIPEGNPDRTSNASVMLSQSSIPGPATNAVAIGVAGPWRTSQTSRRPRIRRRAHGHRFGEQVENELEDHLPGLEEDRRVWLDRQEAGTLEVTPPREGRFERFL